jgi:predicted transcriptional regulator
LIAQTSQEAYRGVKALGINTRQGRAIVAFLKARRGQWSRSELSEELGIRLSSICARVNELMGKGLIKSWGTRKCNITGKKVEAVCLPRA